MSRRASPVVESAPSGTGKTTLAHRLVENSGDYVFSVSATTRRPREGEVDGVDYRFVDRGGFEAMVEAEELIEWAEVHGRLYGTPRSEIERAAAQGKHVVLDIDVQGARQIKEEMPDAKLFFILPPDIDTLMARLTGRGTEEPAAVARRLRSALQELQAVEDFDFLVVNDDLDRCVETIRGIVSGRLKGDGARATLEDALTLRHEIRRILDEEDSEHTNANS